jgi:hypothetical protein
VRDSPDGEFFDDFGAPALTDAELEGVLERARAAGDADVRRLAKQYAALRRASGWLLAHLEGSESAAAVREGEAARLVRFLVDAALRGR